MNLQKIDINMKKEGKTFGGLKIGDKVYYFGDKDLKFSILTITNIKKDKLYRNYFHFKAIGKCNKEEIEFGASGRAQISQDSFYLNGNFYTEISIFEDSKNEEIKKLRNRAKRLENALFRIK